MNKIQELYPGIFFKIMWRTDAHLDLKSTINRKRVSTPLESSRRIFSNKTKNLPKKNSLRA